MSKNTGKEYEKFVHDIHVALTRDEKYTSVELDVWLDGKDGPRQIDVLLRSQISYIDLTTIIECRDYKDRLDITHLDGFHSKLMDVKASKGILVSKKGFSKKAISKANRVGITLCLASKVSDVLDTLKIEIPVRANLIQATIKAEYNLHINEPLQNIPDKSLHIINDFDLHENLQKGLLSEEICPPTKSTEEEWYPKALASPHSIKDLKNNTVQVTELKITSCYKVSYYYGYLEDLSCIQAIHDINSDRIQCTINRSDIPHIPSLLNEFHDLESIPKNDHLTLNLIEISKLNYSDKGFHTYKNKGIFKVAVAGEIPS